MNIRPIIYALTFITAVICVFLSIRSCQPKGYNETLPPAEQNRVKIITPDKIKSAKEQHFTDSLKAKIKTSDERYSSLAAKYLALKQKGSNSVKTYHTSPTLANCDTAVTDLQNQVSNLEAQVSVLDSSGVVKDQIIWSQTGTILRSDSVKQALSNGWKEANLNGAKWEKKAKRRGKVIAVLTAVFAAVIGGVALTN